MRFYEFGKGGSMINRLLLIEMRKGVVTICYCDPVEVFKIVKSECLLQVISFSHLNCDLVNTYQSIELKNVQNVCWFFF